MSSEIRSKRSIHSEITGSSLLKTGPLALGQRACIQTGRVGRRRAGSSSLGNHPEGHQDTRKFARGAPLASPPRALLLASMLPSDLVCATRSLAWLSAARRDRRSRHQAGPWRSRGSSPALLSASSNDLATGSTVSGSRVRGEPAPGRTYHAPLPPPSRRTSRSSTSEASVPRADSLDTPHRAMTSARRTPPLAAAKRSASPSAPSSNTKRKTSTKTIWRPQRDSLPFAALPIRGAVYRRAA